MRPISNPPQRQCLPWARPFFNWHNARSARHVQQACSRRNLPITSSKKRCHWTIRPLIGWYCLVTSRLLAYWHEHTKTWRPPATERLSDESEIERITEMECNDILLKAVVSFGNVSWFDLYNFCNMQVQMWVGIVKDENFGKSAEGLQCLDCNPVFTSFTIENEKRGAIIVTTIRDTASIPDISALRLI